MINNNFTEVRVVYSLNICAESNERLRRQIQSLNRGSEITIPTRTAQITLLCLVIHPHPNIIRIVHMTISSYT